VDEPEMALPMRWRRRDLIGDVQTLPELLDLRPQPFHRAGHGLVADEVGGEDPHDGLVLDARKGRRLARPLP
jgi:hypothetical protein